MGTRVLLAAESIALPELLPQNFILKEAEVTWVSDGISARQFIDDMDPDLLIAEISLGGVSGFELCEWVRESDRHRDMPVILVDGQFEALNQARACEAGVDIYLAKPFDPERIADTVNRLAQRERLDRADPLPASILLNEGLAEAPPLQAKEIKPHSIPNEVRVERAPEIRPVVAPQPEQSRGGKRFPALLLLILIGIILGSLVLLVPRSTPRTEAPKREHGVVSAAVEQPEPEPTEEPQSAPSQAAPSGTESPSGRDSSDARASDRPVAEEAEENLESPGIERSVLLPPLALNSLATTTRRPEPSNDAPLTRSMTAPRNARPAGRAGVGASFRRSGHHMKDAGKNIGSGLKHFGIASKKSAVWSGKRAGSGVKGFGKAVKGIFN